MPDRGTGRIVRIIGVPMDLGVGRRVSIGAAPRHPYRRNCLPGESPGMEIVADSGRLLAMDVVEINLVLDTKNPTGSLAVERISSRLGKESL